MLGFLSRRLSWGNLRKFSTAIVATIAVLSVYLWRLGDSTVGLSPAEAAARHSSLTIHSILTNPVYAPQKIIQYGLQSLGHHGAFWMRLPSVIIAVYLLALFYLFLKSWFGRVIGALSAIILATTPWVVILARSATAEMLLLAPVTLIAGYTWLARSNPKHQKFAWLFLVISTVLCIYVPGLIWLIVVSLILVRKQLLAVSKKIPRLYQAIGALAAILLLVPLIIGVAGNLDVAKNLILWPPRWLGPAVFAKSCCWSLLALFWRTPYHINTIIGRSPLLDITEIALAIFGVVAMWTKARHELYGLSFLVILGIVGAGLDRNLLLITLALPAVIILVAAGLRYLYVEWQSVFPHNPIPRVLAVMIMVLLVALHVIYGVRYSLIAWPHTIATHQVYVIK